jgi:hypothetical protein
MGLEVWLAVAGVAVLVVVGMIALGDLGEPRVPRRGPVTRALDRRERLREEHDR